MRIFSRITRKIKSLKVLLILGLVCLTVYLIGIADIFLTLSDLYVFYTEPSIEFTSLEHQGNLPEPDVQVHLSSKCTCQQHQQYLVKKSQEKVNVYDNNSSRLLYELDAKEFQNLTLTCDLYNELRRGPNQSVLSYSLYGTNPDYLRYAERIVRQVSRLYSDWVIRIYASKSVDADFLCRLVCLKDSDDGHLLDNVDVCSVESVPVSGSVLRTWDVTYMHAMSWRWLPIGDHFVHRFASRDIDTFVYQREVDAVKAWVQSARPGHIMRDSPYHTTTILGGLWGYDRRRDPTTAAQIYARMLHSRIAAQYNQPLANEKQRDQHFLSYYIYPLLSKGRSLVHDSYLCHRFGDSEPFPSRRHKGCYVGAPMPSMQNGTDNCLSRYHYVCPEACRPKKHPEWIYC